MSVQHGYPAPAKLNLMLRVTGRRADGYHLLQTVIRFVDYGDTLTYNVREDGVVARVNEVEGVPAADDLAVRAAQRLKRACGTRLGVDITLEKRLPLGGGLGAHRGDIVGAIRRRASGGSGETGLSRDPRAPRKATAGSGARAGAGAIAR